MHHRSRSFAKKPRGVVLPCPRALLLVPCGRSPEHVAERFEEVNKLPVVERTVGPGLEGPQEASTVRDHVPRRVRDARVLMPAPIKAILSDPADFVVHRRAIFQEAAVYIQIGCKPK